MNLSNGNDGQINNSTKPAFCPTRTHHRWWRSVHESIKKPSSWLMQNYVQKLRDRIFKLKSFHMEPNFLQIRLYESRTGIFCYEKYLSYLFRWVSSDLVVFQRSFPSRLRYFAAWSNRIEFWLRIYVDLCRKRIRSVFLDPIKSHLVILRILLVLLEEPRSDIWINPRQWSSLIIERRY